MGTNLKIESEEWLNDDQRWMGHKKGRDTARPITLDFSLFHANHSPNNFIPSGIALGKVTATGRYGPYSPLLSNGLEVCTGFLFTPTKRTAGDVSSKVGAPMVWEGIIVTGFLPTFTGGAAALGVLDNDAKTDLKFCRFE